MKRYFRRMGALLAGILLILAMNTNAFASDLSGCTGTWLLDEEPVSTLEISDLGNGKLYVEAFYYRIWSMEGTASVTGDGKMAVFQATDETNELGILELEGDSIIFRVIVSPENEGSSIQDFLMDHPFVYHR